MHRTVGSITSRGLAKHLRRASGICSGLPARTVANASLHDVVQSAGWEGAWSQGVTPWETGTASLVLTDLLKRGVLPSGSALVPGCGTARDALALAAAGYNTVALDISPTAVEKAKSILAAGRKAGQIAPFPEGGKLDFVLDDFFTYSPGKAFPGRGFSVLFDYTFMVALPPKMWSDYASTVKRLIRPGGELVMQLFPIGDHKGGPPYAVQPDHVNEMFARHDLECVDLAPVPAELSHKARAGREYIGRWRHTTHRFPITNFK